MVIKRYACYVKWRIDQVDIDGMKSTYERLSNKQVALNTKRPLSVRALQNSKENLFLEWTYNSNNIEGNTLTLQETRIVLQEGMTVKGKV